MGEVCYFDLFGEREVLMFLLFELFIELLDVVGDVVDDFNLWEIDGIDGG